jgi:4-hydroxy-3-methylbut-2-enyl diphosphate reductase
MSQPLRIILAKPLGFCAGVVRAIDIVEAAIAECRQPVYVRHEIVHNKTVVNALKAKGAVFVDEIAEIPKGAPTIFSAHGVSRVVEDEARARGLDVIDATCPLVEKVHLQGRAYAKRGLDVILVGHADHAEVIGTRGQIDGPLHVVSDVASVEALVVRDCLKVAYITQTTLSVRDTRDVIDALKRRFPAIVGPDTRDICYATQNRQVAVERLAETVQLILVIGSKNSSNSNRLREIGLQAGVRSHLIDGPGDIDPTWLFGIDRIGITAGASAPNHLVHETIARLETFRDVVVETLDGTEETIRFRMPARLQSRTAV